MFQTMDKLMMASVGALSMTREKAEKMFDEYVKRGEATRESKEGFVSEMVDFADKNRKEIEAMIGRQLHKSLDNLDIPTKSDLEVLEKKLDQVLKKLQDK